jgi:putative transferase (TIGR04331 family)
MKRLLVTTSHESSWDVNQPTIFLGEWCKKDNRKHVWSKMDFKVTRPYGLDSDKRIPDADEKHKLYDILIKELSFKLNNYHKKNYSVRYWTILIGPWLDSFLMVVMNRYKTLETAIDLFNISKTILINQKDFSLTKNDYSDFRAAIGSDLWNNLLYVEIIKSIKGKKIEIIKENIENSVISNHSNKPNFKIFLKKLVFKGLNLFQLLSRNTDAFIINSYLPIFDEIKLKLSLGQIPTIWRSPNVDKNILQSLKLNRKHFLIEFQNYKGIEKEVRKLINKLIPKCYIEGYEIMCRHATKVNWPSKPKFIYTSNNFTADELFKFWLALKVEKGTPYYVGQHGANYGTYYDSKNWTELNTADRFYSWGWKDIYPGINVIPAFNFKIINKLNFSYDKYGKLLLVERSPGSRDGIRDRYYENLVAQEDMMNLYGKLNKIVQNQSLIRPHPRTSNSENWKKKYKSINIASNTCDIFDLIKQSRLVIFNYDSAGLLELLALNIPVICFWKGDHLLPEAKDYYKLLKDSGIVFNSFEKAANHINIHWEDIDSWWLSSNVQRTRLEFCKQYSRVIKNPISSFKKLLVN